MREMFPMTEEERIGLLRKNLQSDVDKRLAKRDTAAVALDEAQEAEDVARGLLAVFDSMVRERASQHTGSAMEAAVELKRNAEKDGIGVSFAVNGGEPIVVTEAPAVDPITGEVTSKADAVSCDTCGNMDSCNSRQREGSGKTGCGGDSWEPCKAEVLVAWPGNPDMQRIAVGALTRYGELAAKFLNSLPGDDPRRVDSFLDYRIVCLRGPFCTEPEERDPHTVIAAADYGLEFSVEEPLVVAS